MSDVPGRGPTAQSRTLFLVIGPQRSGTTVTYLALHHHPQACGLAEEIHPTALFDRGVLCFTRKEVGVYELRQHYVPRLFEAIALAEAKPSTLAGGLKTAVADRSEAERVVEMLCGPLRHVKVILTIRNDLIAQFGSLKRAELTNQWHSWRAGTILDHKLSLDLPEFIEYAKRCREVHAQLRSLISRREDVLELCYENDVLGDIRGMAAKLYEFVGIDNLEPTWVKSRKVAPPPEDYIQNLDELKRELAALD